MAPPIVSSPGDDDKNESRRPEDRLTTEFNYTEFVERVGQPQLPQKPRGESSTTSGTKFQPGFYPPDSASSAPGTSGTASNSSVSGSYPSSRISRGKRVQDEIQKHLDAQRDFPDKPGWVEPAPGYKLLRPLKAGTFGSVWEAVKVNDPDRKVAIKFFPRQEHRSLDEETKHLRDLTNENGFVQLLDVSRETADWPFYVMNYVEQSLQHLLEDAKPLPTSQAITIFEKLVQTMAYAHGRPRGALIHCDLKPGNILINEQGHPLITDFGQSRLADEKIATLGTEGYMPPDQADIGNDQPDKRWDVYALGAILYVMLEPNHQPPRWEHVQKELSSRKSNRTEAQLKNYREALRNAPLVLTTLPRNLDHDLRQILVKCLATDEKQRFNDAGEIREALVARVQRRKRRPIFRLGLLATVLCLIVSMVIGEYVYSTTIEKSRGTLIEETRNGLNDVARVAAEALENRFHTRVNFLREEATADLPGVNAARAALVAAIDKYQRERTRTPPLIWNDTDRRPVNDWLVELNRRGTSRGLFENRGAGVTINADGRAYSFAACERVGEGASGDWVPESPWRDDNTINLKGTNFAFRDWFNGRGLRDADWFKGEPIEPIRTTHISIVYQTKRIEDGKHPWFVDIVQPMIERKPPQRVLGLLSCGVDVRKDLVKWLTNPVPRVDPTSAGTANESTTGNGETTSNERQKLRAKVIIVDGRGNLVWRDELLDLPSDQEMQTLRKDDWRIQNRDQNYAEFVKNLPDDYSMVQVLDPWKHETEQGLVQDRLICVKLPFHPLPEETGPAWHVLVIKDYNEALKPVEELSRTLVRAGGWAIGVFAVLATGLWYGVFRMLNRTDIAE